MTDLKTILIDAHTIAVVGCSDKPYRTSYAIARYLKDVGYRIIPINPHCIEVLGEKAYPDLQSVPDEMVFDIVNIFRNPEHTAEMVQMTVEYAKKTGMRPSVWTQVGVSTPEAQRLAEAAGLPYVPNRCIMVQHRRLLDS